MSRFFIFCFMFFISAHAFAQSAVNTQYQIQQILKQENLTGISWSLISGDEIKTGNAGLANVKNQIPMRPEQKVLVGSVTKTVLAMGILHLIYENKLSLNTNIEQLLPNLSFNNKWSGRSPITVKHLLEHTAGLDNIRIWQFLSIEPQPDTPLLTAFPTNNRDLLKVRTEPGTQYSYSNMGYTLLGMVIEAVTGQRYESYLDHHFLAPLNMQNSSFEFISQQGPYADPLLAMGYHDSLVSQTNVPSYLRPAGQFSTTATDMAKFMRFILDDGTINGQRLINSQHIPLLATPSNTLAHNNGLSIGHGLALANRDREGVLGMCHPGTTFGFRAYLCLFPEQQKGFFYATNTDSETADYNQFNKAFIHQLNIAPAKLILPTKRKPDLSIYNGIYLLAPNNMAEFELIDRLFNFIWVKSENGHLLVKSLQSNDIKLIHTDDNLFRDVTRTQSSHVFYTDNDGGLFLSNGLKTYKQSSGLGLFLDWLSLIFGLLGLCYLFFGGLVSVLTRKRSHLNILRLPFLNLMLFVIPIYLYLNQSFLSFGDKTFASMSLAVISGALPVTVFFALLMSLFGKTQVKPLKLNTFALICSLQWLLVLFYWQYIPIVFWR